jgi:eukaryotic-like serine/threonine-protein kinase
MSPSEHRLQYPPGHVLAGRFRIVKFLGRGGMGEVYETVDLDLRQDIALKLIRPESRTDPKLLSLLRDEVRRARSVSHRNVCRVYDLEHDQATGVVFVTMELVRGETLSARLKRDVPFKPAEARQLLCQIAEGMDAIHARGMLHMDLKPANVMLEPSGGETPRAIVTDFGLAKSLKPLDSVESTRSLVEFNGGTPLYMAPERFIPGWQLTPAADVYAFGLVAYEMLAGSIQLPQRGSPPPSLRSVVPGTPAEWDAMVKGCLAPSPADRFPNCGAAIGSLDGAGGSPARGKTGLRRHWRSLALATAIAALAASFFFLRPVRPPASAAALRWYNEGVDAIRQGTYYTAVRALEQSLKESPGYPLTHASLAEAWLELDLPERASEEMLRATAPEGSGDRISARDRERLQAVRNTLTRDFGKAVAGYTRLAATAPTAEIPRSLVDLGRALERSKEPRKAIDSYESAVHLDPNYAGAWLRLAVLEGQFQQSEKMADALQRAESLYEASSNVEGATEVFYQRGAYANRQSRLNDAAKWLERARQSALVTRNPHQQIRALYQLSGVAYQQGDTAAGEKLAEEAIGEARESNIEFLAGRGFLDLGNAMSTRGNFVKATEYFNESLRIARNYHNGRLEATALYSLGMNANRTRVDAAGAHQVEQALAWFQANGYPTEASYCLVALGRIRRDSGDLPGAAEAFHKQLDLARASHDELQTLLALSSITFILIYQERFPEALDRALEQLAIADRIGDGLRTAYAQGTVAWIYAELGHFAESDVAARAAETAARKGNMDELLASLTVTRAHTLLLQGRTRDAVSLADQGVRAYEAEFPQETADLLEIMAAADYGAPFSVRWERCERALKMVPGSVANELSLHLTEAELLLEAGKARRALDLYPDARAAFVSRQSEYSLFREELIAALADRQLGQNEDVTVALASAALERFRKRFSSSDWKKFQRRLDFQRYEKTFRKLHS